MKFQIVTEINCGERTCATAPGKFCRFFSSRDWGTQPYCSFFQVDLFHVDGWAQRCPECLESARVVNQEEYRRIERRVGDPVANARI
jgi:hypothetical protein